MIDRYLAIISILVLALTFTVLTLPKYAQAAEKVKYGTAIKVYPAYYLPMMAAEEKGLWKRNGLDGEWVPFRGSVALHQGIAAGDIMIGGDLATSVFQAANRGLPLMIVSNLVSWSAFFMWVRTESQIKKPGDLEGMTIGVSRMGGPAHAYARMVMKRLGLANKVKYIGTGGVRVSPAVLKAGKVDAVPTGLSAMLRLKVRGDVRELMSINDYLPKEWLYSVVFAHKSFVKDKPDTARRTVRVLLQALGFIHKNPGWVIEKMKTVQRYSEQMANMLVKSYRLTEDGKIKKRSVENLRSFLIEYGIVSEGKIPPADQLFTNRLTG